MNIVLLSGGSGKRLWPLSNEVRSKQFIKIFKKDDGSYESMVQRIYRQIKEVDNEASVTIATSKNQVSSIHNQLGEDVGVSVEPCRRDTFAAIVLATAYLHDVKGISANESVVVCPVDPYVDESYFMRLKDLYEASQRGERNIVLMGIEPTYPSEKYGYIIPSADDGRHTHYSFKEKPDELTAEKYIKMGALWNGGVFAYKIKYVLDKARELIGFTDYSDLFNRYETIDRISFDYAVVERERSIDVLRYMGQWKDLGTWNTLSEAMVENTVGNVCLDDTCKNVNVINELDIPILVMGIKGAVIGASPDGILVSNKEQSSYIKPYVDAIDQQIMFAEKSWGSYQVLDVSSRSLTVKITMKANDHMKYHSHEHRDEVWTIVSGQGKTFVDGIEQLVNPGDVITIRSGCKHTIFSITDMVLIEVQIGDNISASDKQKYDISL